MKPTQPMQPPSHTRTTVASPARHTAMKAMIFTLLVGLALTLTGLAHAGVAGQVTHLSGVLSVKKPDGTTKLLSVKSEIQEGDLLITETDAYARVKFVDGGEVVLRPNSQLKVATYSFNEAKPQNDNIFISLLKGGLRAVTGLVGKRNADAVNYSTATATIGIRGTHFGAILYEPLKGLAGGNEPPDAGASQLPPPLPGGLYVDVASGAILVKNQAGEQLIGAGQYGFVAGPTARPIIVPPQQGIQVTMPPSISQNNAGGQGVGKTKESECIAQ